MDLKQLPLFQTTSTQPTFGGLDHDFLEQWEHLTFHQGVVDFSRIHTSFGNGDNLHRQGKNVLIKAKCFPNQSFQPIAGNRIPELSTDGHAQTPEKKALSPGQGKENKVVRVVPPALGKT